MSTKHTPGKWFIAEDDETEIVATEDNKRFYAVATTYGSDAVL